MGVPSFARATRSSALRANPRDEETRDMTPLEGPQRLGKKLKRPSTLTPRVRQNIAYNSDLHHYKPSNSSKPSPLAALPSELRILIYAYVFDDLKRPILMNYGRMRYSPPTLLQVCRAMRIEAAYMYFGEASFTWIVRNLNFGMIMKWLRSLQQNHKGLLSHNSNLKIEIIPRLLKSFTYPPEGFLLDDTMQNHWKACQPFGNLYTIKTIRRPVVPFNDIDHDPTHDHSKILFIIFCRLATWSRLLTQPSYATIRWKYSFDLPSDSHGKLTLYHSLWIEQSEVQPFLIRLKTLWTRNQCENTIRGPILELFKEHLEAFAKLEGPDGVAFREKPLYASLRALGDRIQRWKRHGPV